MTSCELEIASLPTVARNDTVVVVIAKAATLRRETTGIAKRAKLKYYMS